MQAPRQASRMRVGRCMQRKRWGGDVERTGNGAVKGNEEMGKRLWVFAWCLREESRRVSSGTQTFSGGDKSTVPRGAGRRPAVLVPLAQYRLTRCREETTSLALCHPVRPAGRRDQPRWRSRLARPYGAPPRGSAAAMPGRDQLRWCSRPVWRGKRPAALVLSPGRTVLQLLCREETSCAGALAQYGAFRAARSCGRSPRRPS